MDPLIEAAGLWHDFHGTFIHSWRDAIMAALPDDYVARTDLLEEEIRETFIEIYRLSDERLITVVELLSPSNKDTRDRSQYLAKRHAILRQEIHLVELDLLLAGQRLPMQRPLPPGHYYGIISRWVRRPDCEVYHWLLNEALPILPIPLATPDGDLQIDLTAVFETTFLRGRYDRSINYRQPLKLPLAEEDVAWVATTARQERV
jgi:hypothetical protein